MVSGRDLVFSFWFVASFPVPKSQSWKSRMIPSLSILLGGRLSCVASFCLARQASAIGNAEFGSHVECEKRDKTLVSACGVSDHLTWRLMSSLSLPFSAHLFQSLASSSARVAIDLFIYHHEILPRTIVRAHSLSPCDVRTRCILC